MLEELIPEEPNPAALGDPGQGAIGQEERDRAAALRDQIATEMWDSYQEFIWEHPDVLDNNFVPETDYVKRNKIIRKGYIKGILESK